ncbi:Hypothetical predicted protein [Podarcis lilfordi]|uniref:Uncharacterized protein n=1 Tax=Podarcis lilfordi TaxID=74358 RepID=A0AA35KZW8_9SAUR|nr:Hypothetical predicted protein [Podarcis lilfordi]
MGAAQELFCLLWGSSSVRSRTNFSPNKRSALPRQNLRRPAFYSCSDPKQSITRMNFLVVKLLKTLGRPAPM